MKPVNKLVSGVGKGIDHVGKGIDHVVKDVKHGEFHIPSSFPFLLFA